MSDALPPSLALLIALLMTSPAHAGSIPPAVDSLPSPADNTNSEPIRLRSANGLQLDRYATSEDYRITSNVRDGLQHLILDTDPQQILISTRNGVVTLSGIVRDRAERREIIQMVKGVPGTRAVRNALLAQ